MKVREEGEWCESKESERVDRVGGVKVREAKKRRESWEMKRKGGE